MTHLPYYAMPQQAMPLQRPGAVTAFYVYCWLMVAIYLLVAGAGVVYLAMAPDIAARDPEMDETGVRIMGGVLLGMGLVLAAIFAIPTFLPRKMWAWIVGIVIISIGLTSCCLWPLCIPLLIYYVKQPTRWWYGMDVR